MTWTADSFYAVLFVTEIPRKAAIRSEKPDMFYRRGSQFSADFEGFDIFLAFHYGIFICHFIFSSYILSFSVVEFLISPRNSFSTRQRKENIMIQVSVVSLLLFTQLL